MEISHIYDTTTYHYNTVMHLSIALAGYNKYSNAIRVMDTNTILLYIYIYISISHKLASMDINTLNTDKI